MSALPATIYHLDTMCHHTTPPPHGQQEGHARVPNGLARNPNISVQAKAMYLLLASYAGAKGRCWPSVAALAADLGAHERTARKWLAELAQLGVIAVEERPGKPSLYHLTPGADAIPTPGPDVRGTPDADATPERDARTPRAQTPDEEVQEETQGEKNENAQVALPLCATTPFSPYNPHHREPRDEEIRTWAEMSGVPPDEAVEIANYYRARGWHDRNDVLIRHWGYALKSAHESKQSTRHEHTHQRSTGDSGRNGGRPQSSYERRANWSYSDVAASRQRLIDKHRVDEGDQPLRGDAVPDGGGGGS